MPKMMPMSKEKALRPGGHFEYSSKVYFFAPIGAYHVNLSPEARARLKDASVNVEIGEKPKSPDKAKARRRDQELDRGARLRRPAASCRGPGRAQRTADDLDPAGAVPAPAALCAAARDLLHPPAQEVLLRRPPDLLADDPHVRVRAADARCGRGAVPLGRDRGARHGGHRRGLHADRDAELLPTRTGSGRW